MKIIIVENELYLAQSIQNNLSEKINAKCEIYASYDEAIETKGDIYIVNTNLNGNIEKLIEKHGNRELYHKQHLQANASTINEPKVAQLIQFIEKYKKGLEQEILISRKKLLKF